MAPKKPSARTKNPRSTRKADGSDEKDDSQTPIRTVIPPVVSTGGVTEGATRGRPNADPQANAIRAGQSGLSGLSGLSGGLPVFPAVESLFPAVAIAEIFRRRITGKAAALTGKAAAPKGKAATDEPKRKAAAEGKATPKVKAPAKVPPNALRTTQGIDASRRANLDLRDNTIRNQTQTFQRVNPISKWTAVNAQGVAVEPNQPYEKLVARGLDSPLPQPPPPQPPTAKTAGPAGPAGPAKPARTAGTAKPAGTGGFSSLTSRSLAALGAYELINMLTDVSPSTLVDAVSHKTTGDRLNWNPENTVANLVDTFTGVVRDAVGTGTLIPANEADWRTERRKHSLEQAPVLREIDNLANIYRQRESYLSSPSYSNALAAGGYLRVGPSGEPIDASKLKNTSKDPKPNSRHQDISESPGQDFIGPVPSPDHINQVLKDRNINNPQGNNIPYVNIAPNPENTIGDSALSLWDWTKDKYGLFDQWVRTPAGTERPVTTNVPQDNASTTEDLNMEADYQRRLRNPSTREQKPHWIAGDVDDVSRPDGKGPLLNYFTGKRDPRVVQNTYYSGLNLPNWLTEMLPGGPQTISPIQANTDNYRNRLLRDKKVGPLLPPRDGQTADLPYDSDDLNPNEFGRSLGLSNASNLTDQLLKSYSKKKILKKALVSSQYKGPLSPIRTIRTAQPERKAELIVTPHVEGDKMSSYVIPRKGKPRDIVEATPFAFGPGVAHLSMEPIIRVVSKPASAVEDFLTSPGFAGERSLPSSALPNTQELANSLFIGTKPSVTATVKKLPAGHSITWDPKNFVAHVDALSIKEHLVFDDTGSPGTAYPIRIDSEGKPLDGEHVSHSGDAPEVVAHGFFRRTIGGNLERIPDPADPVPWHEIPKTTLIYKKGVGSQVVLDPQSGEPVTHLRYLRAVTRPKTTLAEQDKYNQFPATYAQFPEEEEASNFRVSPSSFTRIGTISNGEITYSEAAEGMKNVFPIPSAGSRPVWVEQSIDDIIDTHKRKWGNDAPDLSIEDIENATLYRKPKPDHPNYSFGTGKDGQYTQMISSPEMRIASVAWPSPNDGILNFISSEEYRKLKKPLVSPVFGSNSLLSKFDFPSRIWKLIPEEKRNDQEYLRILHSDERIIPNKLRGKMEGQRTFPTGGSLVPEEKEKTEKVLPPLPDRVEPNLRGREAIMYKDLEFAERPGSKEDLEGFIRERMPTLSNEEGIPVISPNEEIQLMVYERARQGATNPLTVWKEIKEHIDKHPDRFAAWKKAIIIPTNDFYSDIDELEASGIHSEGDSSAPMELVYKKFAQLSEQDKSDFYTYRINKDQDGNFRKIDQTNNMPSGSPLSKKELEEEQEAYALTIDVIDHDFDDISTQSIEIPHDKRGTGATDHDSDQTRVDDTIEIGKEYGENGQKIQNMIRNLIKKKSSLDIIKEYHSLTFENKKRFLEEQKLEAKNTYNLDLGIDEKSQSLFSAYGYPGGRDTTTSNDLKFMEDYSDIILRGKLFNQQDAFGQAVTKITEFWKLKIPDKQYRDVNRTESLNAQHLSSLDRNALVILQEYVTKSIDSLLGSSNNDNERTGQEIANEVLAKQIIAAFQRKQKNFQTIDDTKTVLQNYTFEYARKLAFQNLQKQSIDNITEKLGKIWDDQQRSRPDSDKAIRATGMFALARNGPNREGFTHFVTLKARQNFHNQSFVFSGTNTGSQPVSRIPSLDREMITRDMAAIDDGKRQQTDSENAYYAMLFSGYTETHALPYLKTIMGLVNAKIKSSEYEDMDAPFIRVVSKPASLKASGLKWDSKTNTLVEISTNKPISPNRVEKPPGKRVTIMGTIKTAQQALQYRDSFMKPTQEIDRFAKIVAGYKTNTAQLVAILKELADDLRTKGGRGYSQRPSTRSDPERRTKNQMVHYTPLMPNFDRFETANFLDPETNPWIIPLVNEHFVNFLNTTTFRGTKWEPVTTPKSQSQVAGSWEHASWRKDLHEAIRKLFDEGKIPTWLAPNAEALTQVFEDMSRSPVVPAQTDNTDNVELYDEDL